MFSVISLSSPRLRLFSLSLAVLVLGLQLVGTVFGQGAATNSLGNGGIHTIQGRIYISTGQRSDITGLRIRLLNFASNDLSVIADGTGLFTFRNLLPGSYSVVLEGGDRFENAQESVYIDDPGSSNLGRTVRLRGATRTASVQMYLRPKMNDKVIAAAQVINAKLAGIPSQARDQYQAAQKAIGENQDEKALAHLRAAVAAHREFSLAWNDLGVLLQKKGDLRSAIDAFRLAVQFDPTSGAANLNLGCALYSDKAYSDAERYLAAALFSNPASYRGHYYMGLTQLKLNRLDVAEQAFLTAVKVGDRQAGMAHYMLAGIYWSVKRYKDAAHQLELYLKLEPDAKDAVKTRESIAELRRKQD